MTRTTTITTVETTQPITATALHTCRCECGFLAVTRNFQRAQVWVAAHRVATRCEAVQ